MNPKPSHALAVDDDEDFCALLAVEVVAEARKSRDELEEQSTGPAAVLCAGWRTLVSLRPVALRATCGSVVPVSGALAALAAVRQADELSRSPLDHRSRPGTKVRRTGWDATQCFLDSR